MQKLVVDTNVFVSSLIQRGHSYHIITELFTNDKLTLCLSDDVFREYYDVLNRERFAKYPDFIIKAQLLLINIKRKSIHYSPAGTLNILSDLGDNKFLELAETSNADFLITGNTNDFTIKKYKGTRIVTPKEFRENR